MISVIAIMDQKICSLGNFRMTKFQAFLSFLTLCLCTGTVQVQEENDYDETIDGKTIIFVSLLELGKNSIW